MKTERTITSKQLYTVEVIHYDNGESEMNRKNEGFSVIEMLGITTMTQQNLLRVLNEAIKVPTEINVSSTGSPLIHKPKKK